jgi:hypothetical protein
MPVYELGTLSLTRPLERSVTRHLPRSAARFGGDRLARSSFVSMIEVRLGSATREFECLFPLVAHHRRVTSGLSIGFAATAIRGNSTAADDN